MTELAPSPAIKSGPVAAGSPVQLRSAGWVIRRAMLGLAILLMMSAGAALLLNATIDRSLDGAAELSE